MRRPGGSLVCLFTLVTVVAGCEREGTGSATDQEAGGAESEVDLAAEERAIMEADSLMLQAARAGDAAAFAEFFAPDGEWLRAYEPAVEGRQAIRERAAADFQMPDFEVEWSTDSVEIAESGDLAYTVGTYRVSLETPEGPVRDEGKSLTVWRKIDGQWKIVADMSAPDLPMPG